LTGVGGLLGDILGLVDIILQITVLPYHTINTNTNTSWITHSSVLLGGHAYISRGDDWRRGMFDSVYGVARSGVYTMFIKSGYAMLCSPL
jgi:hypothetical protein